MHTMHYGHPHGSWGQKATFAATFGHVSHSDHCKSARPASFRLISRLADSTSGWLSNATLHASFGWVWARRCPKTIILNFVANVSIHVFGCNSSARPQISNIFRALDTLAEVMCACKI